MLSLSAVAKQEKNKLSTDSAFLLLLDILLGEDVVRICYNTDNITWGRNVYQSFPFDIGEATEKTDGSDPNLELKISNVSQALQYAVEQTNGASKTEVILRVINTKSVGENPETEEHYVVTKTMCDQEYITFTLGTEYSSRTRRPLARYMKNNCPFRYKGIRCACTSGLATCNHTLSDCRMRNNATRFGGFQGIDQKGVYVH